MTTIATVLAMFGLLASALLVLLTLATFLLVVLHRWLRTGGMAKERDLLASALPDDADLPDVVVQIPSYNEGAMIRRAAVAASRLAWPLHRLHIQLLDDSTDGSVSIAFEVAKKLQARGVQISVHHRADRGEYKAGALRAGMQARRCDYFAILDVDYVPPPDFLRRCMAPLLAEPRRAFVQARFDYLNSSENRLTQAQMLMLDAHLGVEQALRCWAGFPLPFNGTAGVWRREAIEAAGGWRGDTLVEDLDLSYRAWQIGWKGTFLASVSVPGELPVTNAAWERQQRRWRTGYLQMALRAAPRLVLFSSLPMRDRAAVILHFAPSIGESASLVATWSFALACVLQPAFLPLLGSLWLMILFAGQAAMIAHLRSGHCFLRQDRLPWRRFLSLVWTINVMRFWFGIHHGWGIVSRVLQGRALEFDRTPKHGSKAFGGADD